jgi:hypothetical protein
MGRQTTDVRSARRRFTVKFVLAIVAILALAACGSRQPDPSGAPGSVSPSPSGPVLPSPSATPVAAGSPSVQPVPRPSPTQSAAPAAAIKVDKIALVVTDDLRVRSKPRVAADSALRTPLLRKGRAVFVVDGPVEASGFAWYQVAPMRARGEFIDLPFGWVAAAGKDGEAWLAGDGFHCPSAPTDVRSFLAVPALAGLACFGRKDLQISGRLARPEATCGVDIGWTIEPEWLASTCPHPTFYVADNNRADSTFDAILAPGIDIRNLDPGVEPADFLDVIVTGNFDARAAKTCRGVVSEPGTVIELSQPEIILSCRATFVITHIAKRA